MSATETATGEPSPTDTGDLVPCNSICLAGGCDAVVNVKTLGVVGDGLTDDYEALLAVAEYAAAHPGVTLVFPEGTYRIDRYIISGGPNSNGVNHVRFMGVNDVHIIGCNAKIDIKGDFHRGADYMSGGYLFSYSMSVIPFHFSKSVGFSIEGFEVDGHVELTTRDSGVVEGQSYGILTAESDDYTLRNLRIHHLGTDGIILGMAKRADRNAIVEHVTSSNNGRQGMSVIQVRGLTVSDGHFLDTGRTEGEYGHHSPSAGVAIEPDSTGDVKTGEIVFDNCEFRGNLGSQFGAAYAHTTDDVLIKNSQFIAAPDSFVLTVILAVTDGEIRDSVIDAGVGAVFPGYEGSPSAKTTLTDCVIYSAGMGIATEAPSPVIIQGCQIEGTHGSAYAGAIPYIKNPMCEFRHNDVFVPKEAHSGASYHVISLLQNIALSTENHFSTDLMPVADEHFATSYGSTVVINDHYDSGWAFRPAVFTPHDNSMPYSQP